MNGTRCDFEEPVTGVASPDTTPGTDSRSFPSSRILRIVGYETVDSELLWHSTTKAGPDSRGVNAGMTSGRLAIGVRNGVATGCIGRSAS
jgi:hypothetical protein